MDSLINCQSPSTGQNEKETPMSIFRGEPTLLKLNRSVWSLVSVEIAA